jgi:shikimate dehydrogenase
MNKSKHERLFGLIGYPLNNQFSADYFNEKFERFQMNCRYKNLPIQDISEINSLFSKYPTLSGLNVTKPYKEKVIPFLDKLSESAEACSAVNCIEINQSGAKIGHNTDLIGFKKSFESFIGSNRTQQAMVFGDGGAAKAVIKALDYLLIPYIQVIRGMKTRKEHILYSELEKSHFETYSILINTTPLGMFPNTEQMVEIPIEEIGTHHYCYDLIYLPNKTKFLEEAEKRGARIKNGLEMLHLQADEAFRIWMKNES